MTNSTMKTCTKCGETLPATEKYFYRHKTSKGGLNSRCKKCEAEQQHQYREANRVQIAEQQRQYYEANRVKLAERQRQYYADNREAIFERRRWRYIENRKKELERQRQWRETNREQIAEKDHQYYEEHREQIAEYNRQYHIANREQAAKRQRQYREDNSEQIAERMRQWREDNPEQCRIAHSRRRARKQGLTDTFTSEQWVQCLEYFNYTCPVCDNQLRDLFGNVKPHADHWLPLHYEGDDNPGTVANNMICLCSTCNMSKHDKMPAKWLKQKFGTRKANEILARIEAYFEWVREQEGRETA